MDVEGKLKTFTHYTRLLGDAIAASMWVSVLIAFWTVIIAAVFMLLSVAVRADTPNGCLPTQEAMQKIRQWGEAPFFYGKSEQGSTIVITMGQDRSWSIFEKPDSADVMCLRSFGSSALSHQEALNLR